MVTDEFTGFLVGIDAVTDKVTDTNARFISKSLTRFMINVRLSHGRTFSYYLRSFG